MKWWKRAFSSSGRNFSSLAAARPDGKSSPAFRVPCSLFLLDVLLQKLHHDFVFLELLFQQFDLAVLGVWLTLLVRLFRTSPEGRSRAPEELRLPGVKRIMPCTALPMRCDNGPAAKNILTIPVEAQRLAA